MRNFAEKFTKNYNKKFLMGKINFRGLYVFKMNLIKTSIIFHIKKEIQPKY